MTFPTSIGGGVPVHHNSRGDSRGFHWHLNMPLLSSPATARLLLKKIAYTPTLSTEHAYAVCPPPLSKDGEQHQRSKKCLEL